MGPGGPYRSERPANGRPGGRNRASRRNRGGAHDEASVLAADRRKRHAVRTGGSRQATLAAVFLTASMAGHLSDGLIAPFTGALLPPVVGRAGISRRHEEMSTPFQMLIMMFAG